MYIMLCRTQSAEALQCVYSIMRYEYKGFGVGFGVYWNHTETKREYFHEYSDPPILEVATHITIAP